ncbi:MAG: hypothetical protein NPINA01_09710 [Nitrospinaceae bacterium]|nr:MAG: hypothetical protein NPINA01_09710 [Nitrospinaceae bacterium]
MKRYAPILLLLSIVLFFVTDHLKVDSSKSQKPSPAGDHDHSGHSADDHSDPENNRRMGIFHFNEGNKSLRQGKWDEAEKNYKMALHHNEEFQETFINLSTTYFRAGKYDEALKTLRDLETINASNPLLHYNLACYYSLTKQSKASLNSIKKAVDLGYKDFQEIEIDPDLENMRDDADFKAWFQSIQGNPRK